MDSPLVTATNEEIVEFAKKVAEPGQSTIKIRLQGEPETVALVLFGKIAPSIVIRNTAGH